MANTHSKTDPRFWTIYRAIRKANPDYSVKRLLTLARYAYKKRYTEII